MNARIAARCVMAGASSGTLWVLKSGEPTPAGVLLYTSDLTHDVVAHALRSQAIGILTSTGSFAGHAANILRAARADKVTKIGWFTDAPDDIGDLHGQKVHVVSPAWDQETDADAYVDHVYRANRVRDLRIIFPTEASESDWQTFWPHRCYDNLTFSIMARGLSQSMRRLTGVTPEIGLGADSRIYFGGSVPSVLEIADLASDETTCNRLVKDAIAAYGRIIRRTEDDHGQNGNLVRIGNAIEGYFSHQLLLHDTYEVVIARCIKRISAELQGIDPEEIANLVLASRLSLWFSREEIRLPKVKNLFQDLPVVKSPPFSPSDDLRSSTRRSVTLLRAYAGREPPAAATQAIVHATGVFVTKEWKFFLNKYLYSRYNSIVRSRFSDDWPEIEPILRAASHGTVISLVGKNEPSAVSSLAPATTKTRRLAQAKACGIPVPESLWIGLQQEAGLASKSAENLKMPPGQLIVRSDPELSPGTRAGSISGLFSSVIGTADELVDLLAAARAEQCSAPRGLVPAADPVRNPGVLVQRYLRPEVAGVWRWDDQITLRVAFSLGRKSAALRQGEESIEGCLTFHAPRGQWMGEGSPTFGAILRTYREWLPERLQTVGMTIRYLVEHVDHEVEFLVSGRRLTVVQISV